MTDDWHTSDYPELRPGPPWVMEEMILAQAALPDDLAALDGAHAIHAAAARALAAGEEIVVVGCGTSEHAAMAIAALLRDGLATSRRDAGGSGRSRPWTPRSIPRRTASSSASAMTAGHAPPGSRSTARVAPARSPRRSRPRRLGRRGGGRPRPLDAAPRSLVVPYRGLHERHPGGRGDRLRRVGHAWPASARATLETALAADGARTAGRGLYPAQRVLCVGTGLGPHQRPRARAQDRGRRAHRSDRPSPRDAAPRAPGRRRARSRRESSSSPATAASAILTADGWRSPPRPPPRSAFARPSSHPGDPHAPAGFRPTGRARLRGRPRLRAPEWAPATAVAATAVARSPRRSSQSWPASKTSCTRSDGIRQERERVPGRDHGRGRPSSVVAAAASTSRRRHVSSRWRSLARNTTRVDAGSHPARCPWRRVSR